MQPAVSVLYREPKLLKVVPTPLVVPHEDIKVSVLYREPKLLKASRDNRAYYCCTGFSALP